MSISAPFEYINPYLIRKAKIEIENEMTKKYPYYLTKFKNAFPFLGKSDFIFNKKYSRTEK